MNGNLSTNWSRLQYFSILNVAELILLNVIVHHPVEYVSSCHTLRHQVVSICVELKVVTSEGLLIDDGAFA